MTKRVLIVAAHPDDEVLGCGGTIARHVDAGDEVQILIVAEGVTSRQASRNRAEVLDNLSELSHAAHKAANILGATDVELLDFPDNRRHHYIFPTTGTAGLRSFILFSLTEISPNMGEVIQGRSYSCAK